MTASLTDFEWKSAVSESKNPQINKPYQDGADYKINVGGIEYNYGISAHPYNETTPSTITYDLSAYDYDCFTVTVGKTKEKEHKRRQSGHDRDIPHLRRRQTALQKRACRHGSLHRPFGGHKGVKTLTLAIEAGAGGYGWGACAWCEPTLYNDLDSGEVAISSPLNEEERKLVGNGEITICGAARDVSSIRALLGGKMIASAKTGADGGFNLKIKSRNLELGKNQVVFKPDRRKGS